MSTPQFYAESLLKNAMTKEPEITNRLQDIVAECGGRLDGLAFRLKSSSSLARKIETDPMLDDISLEEAARQIKDVLRYTVIFEPEYFGESYQKMKLKLLGAGVIINSVKNTWLQEGPYKGVNTFVEKEGMVFEIQYHTQESFDLKNGTLHTLYEERRLPMTSRNRKFVLDKEMILLSQKLQIPQGIKGVD